MNELHKDDECNLLKGIFTNFETFQGSGSKDFGTPRLKVLGTMNSSVTLDPSIRAQTSIEMRPSKKKSKSSFPEHLSPTPSLDLYTESRPVVYIAESPVLFHSPQPRMVTPKLPWYAPQRLLLPFQFVTGTLILIILIIIMLKVFGVIGGTGTRTETYRPVLSSKVIGSTTATMYIDTVEISVATVTVTAALPPGRTTAAKNLDSMPTAATRPVGRITKDLVAGVGAPRRMNGSSLALVVGIGVWVLGEAI